jgi:hypothetical protein
MAAIGGDTPKFLQVVTSEEETSPSTSVRIEVVNPHLVGIGDVVVEVRDGAVHVASSPAGTIDLVLDGRDPQ